jgi:hypothetical protein
MANTYTLINSGTVGSGGASDITFSSIPQTYTDLMIFVSARAAISQSFQGNYINYNGSNTGYSNKNLEGQGSGTLISYATKNPYAGYINGATSTANTFSNISIYIPNYTSSNYKSYSVDTVYEDNTTFVLTEIQAVLWSNTAAITSIKLFPPSDTYVQYSTAYLYGIKNS